LADIEAFDEKFKDLKEDAETGSIINNP